MGSVLVVYTSNLDNVGRTVITTFPGARCREYVMRRMEGALGCIPSGSEGTFTSSLGAVCRTSSRRGTELTLSHIARG